MKLKEKERFVNQRRIYLPKEKMDCEKILKMIGALTPQEFCMVQYIRAKGAQEAKMFGSAYDLSYINLSKADYIKTAHVSKPTYFATVSSLISKGVIEPVMEEGSYRLNLNAEIFTKEEE